MKFSIFNFQFSNKKNGQILVETIIGVGVVSIVLSAIIPLFLVGTKAGTGSWQAEVARGLAQEELEAAKSLKVENWNNIYRPLGTNNKGSANLYHVEENLNVWSLNSGVETTTLNNINFARSLQIDNVSRTDINGAGDLESIYTSARDDPSTQKITVKVSWPGSIGYEIVDYFSRWQNSLWQQTDWSGGAGQANWQGGQTNKFFSETQIDTATLGQLKLATVPGGTANDGNEFTTASITNIGRLNNSGFRDAVRFSAHKNASINQIRLYVDEVLRGNQVTFRYGIQGDSAGQPSGAYLSWATASFNTTGWQTVNIPSLSLSLGTVYYIVVEYDSGSAPASNRYINFRSSLPQNLLVPKAGDADSNFSTFRYAGSWTNLSQTPIFVLRYTDNTYDGNPYDNFADRRIFSTFFEGETVSYASDTSVSGVGLYVAQNAANSPQDNLYLTIDDATDNINLVPNQQCLLPGDVTTAFAWKECDFSSGSVTFLANHAIRVYFSSPGTTNNRSYLINNVSNPASAEYTGINWKSTDAVTTRSTNSGGSFSDITFVDMAYYLKVAATISYAPWGELESSTFDTANISGAGYNIIFWNPLGSLPVGTTIKMQLAANNDNSTWNWSGPSGIGSSYTISIGENIWTDLYSANASEPARYLRYKIRLETTDQSVTPILDNVNINWSY